MPTFSSSKYHCDPVWSIHVPQNVASDYIKADVLKKYATILANNPSLTDKVFPSQSTIDSIGRNSLDLGLGTAAVISAVQDASPAAAIGSAITAGLKTLTSLRSEDKTQDRQDACMPRDAKAMWIITEDAKIFISKDEKVSMEWAKAIELAPKEKEITVPQPPR